MSKVRINGTSVAIEGDYNRVTTSYDDGSESVSYEYRDDNMNTVNYDGRAYNGNDSAVSTAFLLILTAIVIAFGFGFVALAGYVISLF